MKNWLRLPRCLSSIWLSLYLYQVWIRYIIAPNGQVGALYGILYHQCVNGWRYSWNMKRTIEVETIYHLYNVNAYKVKCTQRVQSPFLKICGDNHNHNKEVGSCFSSSRRTGNPQTWTLWGQVQESRLRLGVWTRPTWKKAKPYECKHLVVDLARCKRILSHAQ